MSIEYELAIVLGYITFWSIVLRLSVPKMQQFVGEWRKAVACECHD